jgi:flagellar hook-length control protein FliK
MNLTLLNLAPTAETATTALSPAAANGLTTGLVPEETGLDFAGQLDAQLGQLAAGVPGSALTAAGEPKGKGFTALTADGKAALVAAAAATGKTAAGKTQAADLVSQLAAAVEKLTQPGTAPAALASRDARVEKSDTNAAGSAEKEDDQQAIQSLFAMLGLPAPVMAPAQAATAGTTAASGKTARDAAAALGGSATSALSTALTTATQTTASPAAAHTAQSTDNTAAVAATPAVAPAESLESAATLLSAAQPQKELPAPVADSTPQPAVQALAMPVAATAATATAATPVAAAPQITSPLDTPEWQQALGQQVLMFTRHGQQSAELRLHPEDLGALQISLKIDNDQAQLHFVSAHQQVRAAVEAAMPHLRTALAESGISLGQSSVGSDSSAWQQAQQQQTAQQQGGRSTPNSWGATDARTAAEPLAAPASLVSRLGGGGVDIFA